jgi:pyrroloquinoline quinone (PQQ) biosynthesis protein C
MPRNLTGETYALKNAASLTPKNWGPGKAFGAWWPEVEARLSKLSATQSTFVKRVETGALPREQLQLFVKDLVILSKQIPLHEARFAARSNFHGEDTVLILSHGPALGLGYAGFRFMPDLAREFAEAYGLLRPDIDAHKLSPWPTAYLNALYDYSSYPEMGIAATMVDAQWAELATRLRSGFVKHYRVAEHKTEIFEALAAMDGPRTKMRPVILEDMARTAYHQSMVRKSVITVTSLWRRMWDAWERPDLCGLIEDTTGSKAPGH